MTRRMQDSGIPYVGIMPEEWQLLRGKYILTKLQRPVKIGDGIVTCFRDGEVTLRSNRREDGFTMSDKEIGYQGVDIGDLVVHGMDGFAGAIGISDSRGKASPVLNVLDSVHDKRFLKYYLRSMAYGDVFTAWSTGIRVRSCDLGWNKLSELKFMIPTITEQHQIADYLDKKCESIDAAIDAGEKEIEKLKEYKQAVITNAVTKGLNNCVPMKETGISWIGAIPINWTIKRVRRITKDHLQGYYDESGYVDNGYRLLRITDLKSNGGFDINDAPFVRNKPGIRKFELKPGDFCFARTGGAGSFCYIDKIENRVVFASYLIRFRFCNQCLDYLKYAFLSDVFLHEINTLIHGGVNQNIHAENIKDAKLPFPPLVEQKEIAEYLNLKIPQIDNLISIRQEQINRITEYKKAVIYAYITGKKEVPNG